MVRLRACTAPISIKSAKLSHTEVAMMRKQDIIVRRGAKCSQQLYILLGRSSVSGTMEILLDKEEAQATPENLAPPRAGLIIDRGTLQKKQIIIP